jgi:Na+-driven multidrug efflux pump
MRRSTIICFLLFLSCIALGLLQLWFNLWNAETFFKILVTDMALLAVCFIWSFLVKENKENKKIDGGNSLD